MENFDLLPNETLLQIAEKLDNLSLFKIMQVNIRFSRVFKDLIEKRKLYISGTWKLFRGTDFVDNVSITHNKDFFFIFQFGSTEAIIPEMKGGDFVHSGILQRNQRNRRNDDEKKLGLLIKNLKDRNFKKI